MTTADPLTAIIHRVLALPGVHDEVAELLRGHLDGAWTAEHTERGRDCFMSGGACDAPVDDIATSAASWTLLAVLARVSGNEPMAELNISYGERALRETGLLVLPAETEPDAPPPPEMDLDFDEDTQPMRRPLDGAGLADVLREAVADERPDVVLQALHIGCGGLALQALGIDTGLRSGDES